MKHKRQMEYLGGINLFTSHFVIGSSRVAKNYTQTETNVFRALQKWLEYKDTDWGMKRYRTERTQYVSFLNIIELSTLKQLVNEIVIHYKKQFPYSSKEDFIKHVFSYSIFDLKQIIEREYTWLSEAPGEPDFCFYTYFSDSDKEFLDFAIPSDQSIEHYKQYYRKVIEIIENLDFESIQQPEANTPPPQFTKEPRDKYKEHFGVERPSVLYENSERIEWVVSETDAERINARWATANIKAGEKGTKLPPPETNEKAWERLVKLNAQRTFESLQIRWMESTAPKALKAIQDRLKVINKFIEEAESLSLIDATEKPNFDNPKQEYLRIKYNYYNKNFCGSKDGISIPGRTPNSGLTASIYAEYFLFKNWLEELKNEIGTTQPTKYKNQKERDIDFIQGKRKEGFGREIDVTTKEVKSYFTIKKGEEERRYSIPEFLNLVLEAHYVEVDKQATYEARKLILKRAEATINRYVREYNLKGYFSGLFEDLAEQQDLLEAEKEAGLYSLLPEPEPAIPQPNFNSKPELPGKEISEKIKKHFGFFQENCPRKLKQILNDEDFKKLIEWTIYFYKNNFKVPEISDPIRVVNTNKTFVQLAFKYLFKELHKASPYPKSLFEFYKSAFTPYSQDKQKNFEAVQNNNEVKKLMQIDY